MGPTRKTKPTETISKKTLIEQKTGTLLQKNHSKFHSGLFSKATNLLNNTLGKMLVILEKESNSIFSAFGL
jgi:hypothetical protein